MNPTFDEVADRVEKAYAEYIEAGEATTLVYPSEIFIVLFQEIKRLRDVIEAA